LHKIVRYAILLLDARGGKEVKMYRARTTISSKGQVVIPSKIRKALGIHAGMELIFKIHDDIIEAQPVRKSIEAFFGCCKQKTKNRLSISDMEKAIGKAVSENDTNKDES
jgi:antitoxin PrlF